MNREGRPTGRPSLCLSADRLQAVFRRRARRQIQRRLSRHSAVPSRSPGGRPPGAPTELETRTIRHRLRFTLVQKAGATIPMAGKQAETRPGQPCGPCLPSPCRDTGRASPRSPTARSGPGLIPSTHTGVTAPGPRQNCRPGRARSNPLPPEPFREANPESATPEIYRARRSARAIRRHWRVVPTL